jgi:hypothetical protein
MYWDLRTNSPFYGWGQAGRFETTGLAISALAAWRSRHEQPTELDAVIRRGVVFLLRGRDRWGSWCSTQSTVRAMRAMADSFEVLDTGAGDGGSIEVRANGSVVKVVTMPNNRRATDPILVDMSPFLDAGNNQLELRPASGLEGLVMMRFASTSWLPWTETQVRSSPELRLGVQFDRLEANAGEPIRCSVKAERVGFRGYGMMLAEIGLPPGAEVDRASLEACLRMESIDTTCCPIEWCCICGRRQVACLSISTCMPGCRWWRSRRCRFCMITTIRRRYRKWRRCGSR